MHSNITALNNNYFILFLSNNLRREHYVTDLIGNQACETQSTIRSVHFRSYVFFCSWHCQLYCDQSLTAVTLTFHDVKENNSPFASTVSSLSCNLLGTYVRLSAFCLTLANKLFLLLPRIGYPIPSSLHPSISVTSRINSPCCHIYISQYRQIGNSLSTYCFKFVVRLVSSAPYFSLTHDAPLFCC